MGGEILCLSRKIARYVYSTGNRQKIEEMTGSNSWVIAYIGGHAETDVFQRDLEKEFGITRSTASKNLDLLEKKGFIERRRVEQDARLKKLALTKKSEDILNLIKADRENMEAALTKGFSEEELSALHGYIRRLMANLETTTEETK